VVFSSKRKYGLLRIVSIDVDVDVKEIEHNPLSARFMLAL